MDTEKHIPNMETMRRMGQGIKGSSNVVSSRGRSKVNSRGSSNVSSRGSSNRGQNN